MLVDTDLDPRLFWNIFFEAVVDDANAGLIGQFGVGFHLSFLAADNVSVTSKFNE